MSAAQSSACHTDYDHSGISGSAGQREGIDDTWSHPRPPRVFARFTFIWSGTVSELSFREFCAQVTRDKPNHRPAVVCSRLFRFSSFYVNRRATSKRGRSQGQDHRLAGMGAHRRVYMRAGSPTKHGIALARLHWYQAGAH